MNSYNLISQFVLEFHTILFLTTNLTSVCILNLFVFVPGFLVISFSISSKVLFAILFYFSSDIIRAEFTHRIQHHNWKDDTIEQTNDPLLLPGQSNFHYRTISSSVTLLFSSLSLSFSSLHSVLPLSRFFSDSYLDLVVLGLPLARSPFPSLR